MPDELRSLKKLQIFNAVGDLVQSPFTKLFQSGKYVGSYPVVHAFPNLIDKIHFPAGFLSVKIETYSENQLRFFHFPQFGNR